MKSIWGRASHSVWLREDFLSSKNNRRSNKTIRKWEKRNNKKAEINEIEIKHIQEGKTKAKHWFFEEFNKNDKSWLELLGKIANIRIEQVYHCQSYWH